MTADEQLAHAILLEIERRIHARVGKVSAEIGLALSEAYPDVVIMVRDEMDLAQREARAEAFDLADYKTVEL